MDNGANEAKTKGSRKKGKVNWDRTDVQTSYADACSVSMSHDEVTLLFGTSPARQAGLEEMVGSVGNRIILSPHSAKRTVRMLSAFLAEYETRYGPLDPQSAPVVLTDIASVLWEKADKRVHDLIGVIQGLGVEFGFERSFKMSAGTLLDRRFLISLLKGALGPEAQEKIYRVCRELGMPKEFDERYAAELSRASFCHFGLEESETSIFYKVYLEFWSDWEKEILDRPARTEPFLLHLAFKWDTTNTERRVLTKYICYPRLSNKDMAHRISEIYSDTCIDAGGRAIDTAKNILEMAASRVDQEKLLYLEVTEEDNPRISFDINVYKAGMSMKLIYPLVLELRRDYQIPEEYFAQMFKTCENSTLGHMSGGIDREGRDFFTIYYGMKGYRPG